MSTLKRIALILVIVGAVNWGLIGFFQFDLVAAIFGGQEAALSRVIYSLVGLSGLFCLTILFDPMSETNSQLDNNQQIQSNNVNYGVEFGEDTDDDYKSTNRDTNPERK
ncbi:hypothetical protein GCM10011409_16050 [Lentibacillus populi]|uniref:DUF378 domain-containing protein n=1 Tax=Lentibacillus populi TaxID=1827502 RepID=A0A9W5X4Y7_9BACI|nr:DUF378 domain-containing protein [Lentibacillus populi]GGB39295.1 hypothetical protein GCM10011409_16050 [Lentibacillus populi]